MRISTDEDDEIGFRTFIENGAFAAKWRVYLDNKDVTAKVVTADDEAGIVVGYTWRDGKPLIDASGVCFARETLIGEVRIERGE